MTGSLGDTISHLSLDTDYRRMRVRERLVQVAVSRGKAAGAGEGGGGMGVGSCIGIAGHGVGHTNIHPRRDTVLLEP